MVAVAFVLLLSVACGSATGSRLPAASPSASPAASPVQASPAATQLGPNTGAPGTGPASNPTAVPSFAVLVDLLSDPNTYTASAIGGQAQVLFSTTAAQRTAIAIGGRHAIALPYVSTSGKALYYLDGDSTVHRYGLDRKTSIVAHLDVAPGMEAAFAVSPNDTTLAVSVLDFNRTPVHLTLYTQALGGTARQVIFESDSDYGWPVAWHAGLLVLAHAYGPFEEQVALAAPGRGNPYSAISYHVIDPTNGNRLVLMGSCTVSGPLSPTGSGCIQGGAIDWQGVASPAWSTHDWGSISSAAALSPDGRWMAAAPPDSPNAMAIYRPDGRVGPNIDGPGPRDWAGWLDGQTIVMGSYLDPTWRVEVVNAMSMEIEHYSTARGFFAAVLPTNIV